MCFAKFQFTFPLCSGETNERKRRTNKTDERSPEWNKGIVMYIEYVHNAKTN